MILWMKITSFGGITVMAPAAAVIAAWLIIQGAWRMALWWCLLFIAGMGLVIATKLAFIGWGIGIRSLDLTGFSGHAMRATTVFPVMLYLMLQKSAPIVRAGGILLGIALGAAIGISRLALQVHSVSEVVAGCALGAIVSFGFIWLAGALQKAALNRWLLVFSLVPLLAASEVEPAPTQHWLTEAALYLSGHDKPFTRADWKLPSP